MSPYTTPSAPMIKAGRLDLGVWLFAWELIDSCATGSVNVAIYIKRARFVCCRDSDRNQKKAQAGERTLRGWLIRERLRMVAIQGFEPRTCGL